LSAKQQQQQDVSKNLYNKKEEEKLRGVVHYQKRGRKPKEVVKRAGYHSNDKSSTTEINDYRQDLNLDREEQMNHEVTDIKVKRGPGRPKLIKKQVDSVTEKKESSRYNLRNNTKQTRW
jgi:hypothetical protein